MRCWVRKRRRSLGFDDLAIVLSLIGFLLLGSMILLSIRYGIGTTTTEPGSDPIRAAMYFTIAQVVYIVAAGILKVAVGLVLFRLVERDMELILRRIIGTSMVIVALWSAITAGMYAFQCFPSQAAWGIGQGTCLPSAVLGNAGVALSAMDVVISWFYGLFPVWLLFKVQIPTMTKVSVMILLGLSALSSVATIFRFKYVLEVTQASDSAGISSPKVIEKALEGTVYSIIEIGMGIFATALTVMGALLNRCLSGTTSHNISMSIPLGPIRNNSASPSSTYGSLSRAITSSQQMITPVKPANAITRRTDVDVYYDDDDLIPGRRNSQYWLF